MGGVRNLAKVGLELGLGQLEQRQADQKLRKERRRAVAERNAELARAERKQSKLLERRIAAARARAGGAGIATSGGSIDAIIRGFENDASEVQADLRRDASNDVGEINRRVAAKRKRNLLENVRGLAEITRSFGARRRSLLD